MNIQKTVLLVLAIVGFSVSFAEAQEVTPAGVVTLAYRTTLGNHSVSVGSTVFSGDPLRTEDDGHLSVQSGSVQVSLGPNTAARIFHRLNRVIVEVEQGSVTYAAKGANEDLTIFALDIQLVPKTSVPAAGQVSIVSRCDVKATAFHSTIEVTSGRESRTIEETKSFRVLSEFGVDYRNSWQPVLTDYPEFPRDANYHKSHSHVACPAGIWQTAKSPVAALGKGHFAEIVGGSVGIITGLGIQEVFESPDRP